MLKMIHLSSASRSAQWSSHYLVFLSSVLLGYAIFGKGFAYLGLAPIFIAELSFVAGLVILLRTGCVIASLTTLPSLILAVTMAWVLLRTLPFFGIYGFDALRDSVVIMYGGFAFVIIALLLEDIRRINTILRYYAAFLNIYIPTIPFLYAGSRWLGEHIPTWPGYNVPMLQLRIGEVAAHLAGAAVFALVGFRNMSPIQITSVSVTALVVGGSGRGAMLAIALPITFAVLMLGKVYELTAVLVAAVVLFFVVHAIEINVIDYQEATISTERSLSTQQVVDNIESIFGEGRAQGNDTRAWRLEWWDSIIKGTVFGPHFWTGRGFGLNLAEADGFMDGDHPDLPPLRSPHSGHMTILARAGVPGVLLWGAFLASWFSMVIGALRIARRYGQTEWACLFLFICCYVMSIIIDASFDVALEGPMLGVWFWCLIGFGIGSVMVYRRQPKEGGSWMREQTWGSDAIA